MKLQLLGFLCLISLFLTGCPEHPSQFFSQEPYYAANVGHSTKTNTSSSLLVVGHKDDVVNVAGTSIRATELVSPESLVPTSRKSLKNENDIE